VRAAERPAGIARPGEYPGESRRVLDQLETAAVKIEEVEYAAGLCLARHAHERAEFIYILNGPHWSGHSRGGDDCLPGTVRFLPAGEPHENYFPVVCRCLGVELPAPLVELAKEEGAIPGASGELASPGAAAQGARLELEFRQKDDLTGPAVEGLLLELLTSGVRRSGERSGATPRWLLRVRERLYEQRTRHLTLAELAQCAGRHPVQVSRQFRRHFGCTISEYVRQLRVARAQMLLPEQGLSLAEVALASGFADQSHFTNAFRRLTGIPPHRYRMRQPGNVPRA